MRKDPTPVGAEPKRWRRFLASTLWALAAGLNLNSAAASEPFPKAAEWPCDRRHPSLDARSPLPGHLTQPRVVWRQFVGALESLVVIEPGEGDTELALHAEVQAGPPDAVIPSLESFRSTPTTPEDDNRSPTVTYADVLPEEPGRERLEFESGFNKPTVNGQWQRCVGCCFARRNGQWVQVWQTEPLEGLFQPLPLAGDFDGDGGPEVAILPFHELLLLDGRTGRIKDRCRFTDTRSYGFFGVYDFDRDGKAEFLVQADFSKHIDVLGFRDGKLSLLWQRNIEPDISDPHKILRVGPTPVADVDGDGRAEVLACIFNDGGDQRWHLTIHDALNGHVKADLADEYLAAPLDVDGDGVSELLTIATTGGGVPRCGNIRVLSLAHVQPRVLWQQSDSTWQMWEPPLPPNVKSTATFGAQTVLSRERDARPIVVVRQNVETRTARLLEGRVRLDPAQWTKNGFRSLYSVTGLGLDGIGLDEGGRLLVRARHSPGPRSILTVRQGKGLLQSTRRIGGSPGPVVVAWPDRAARPTLVVQGVGEELVEVHPPELGKTATGGAEAPGRRHDLASSRTGGGDRHRAVAKGSVEAPAAARWAGRGQSTSWPETRGPVIADLDGNGRRQMLLATSAPSGCARFTARELAGPALWHHDFPDLPGTAPIWNTGGIILWQTGHFTHARRQDVLVTLRRSMMHSEETLLLSGRDGREVWRRSREISQRGVGGTPFAVADFDGDGLDDAASLHPSILYVLNGATGRDLVAKDASWPGVPAQPVYWGLPFAGDFLGEGQAAIFFGGRSMTGVLRPDGSLVWWDALDQAPQGPPAFGDFDGDGRLEAIGVGYPDGARCYDTATGKTRWRLAMQGTEAATGSASADLDSDGREEAVFVMGKSLVCLGVAPDGQRGEIRWQTELPARIGPPSLALLERDGPLSLLLVGEDGYVYCIQ